MASKALFYLSGENLRPERTYRLELSRVVFADYRSIWRDFCAPGQDFIAPFACTSCGLCSSRNQLCPSATDRWLLHHAAVISAAQRQPNAVNSRIDARTASFAYRPAYYGRSLLVEVRSPSGANAFLDVKGCGVGPGAVPINEIHADGLEYVSAALSDYFYQSIIDRIFASSRSPFETAKTYAIIDAGFDIVGGWQGVGPAGLHVRKAVQRTKISKELPPFGSKRERAGLYVELLLRKYGLTTTTAGTSLSLCRSDDGSPFLIDGHGTEYRNLSPSRISRFDELEKRVGLGRIEFENAQLTDFQEKFPSAYMVDFGHVSARRRFQRPMATRVSNRTFCIGHLFPPSEVADFAPDPDLAINAAAFNRESVNSVMHGLAISFRRNRISRKRLAAKLRFAVAAAWQGPGGGEAQLHAG